MGKGPRSTNERRQSKLRTTFVHIPTVDWAAVRVGTKTELRVHPNFGGLPLAHNIPYFPIVAVAWTQTHAGQRHEELMIVEDAWQEPLRAISEDSLAREGFATRQEFKTYWIKRHTRGGWRGMSTVIVIRIRPMDDDDLREQKDALFRHLYGLWLPD